MHALEERHTARGLRVISVTKHGKNEVERARIEEVARNHGMTSPSYLDVDKSWSKAAGLLMNPSFILLDREGRVAYRSTGQLERDDHAWLEMDRILSEM